MPISDLKEISAPASFKLVGVGRREMLEKLEQVILPVIDNVIEEIVHSKVLENVKLPEEIVEPIGYFLNFVKDIPESQTHENFMQRLRFLVLVINNRLDQIQNTEIRDQVNNYLQGISSNIGVVPQLNKHVPQPDPEFQPTRHNLNCEQWKTRIWRSPSRSNAQERLEFYQKSGLNQTSSVRAQLLFDDQYKSKKVALSYEDADYYKYGDLHADHLQPSENILYRQHELIEAMNRDPLFASKMLRIDKINKYGYFIKDPNNSKKICGSKKFFMDYHNCIDNLWLISASANTGMGKGKKEPLAWLMNHEYYGKVFFNNIGSVCRDSILYTTDNGDILCKAAKNWFRHAHAQEITYYGNMLKFIKEPMTELAQQTISAQSKRENRNFMARLTALKVIANQIISPQKSKKIAMEDVSYSADEAKFEDDRPTPQSLVNDENLRSMMGKALDSTPVRRNIFALIANIETAAYGLGGDQKSDSDKGIQNSDSDEDKTIFSV